MLRVLGGVDRRSRSHRGLLLHGGVLAGLSNFWVAPGARPEPHVHRGRFGKHRVVWVANPILAGEILRDDQRTWIAATKRAPNPSDIDAGPEVAPSAHRPAVPAPLRAAFERDALRGYVDAASPMLERAVAQWTREGDVAFDAAARDLFACVAAKIFMGVDDPAEALELAHTMRVLREGRTTWPRYPMLSPSHWRARRAYRTLFARLQNEFGLRRVSDAPDMLSRLREGDDGENRPDVDAAIRTFLALMSSTFSGAADGVTRMAYMLATHPVWQERLQTEAILTTLDRVTFEGLEMMERHDHTWRETLRCDPIAPTVLRRARHELELEGLRLDEGDLVAVRLGAALRDPTFWESPDAFDPDRFNPSRGGVRRGMMGFVPFDDGPLAPLADRLCTLQVKAFWHAFGTRARMRLAPGCDHLDRDPLPIEMSPGPLDVHIEPLVARQSEGDEVVPT